MLIWTLVIGVMLTIVLRSKELTDVSGMSSPWESLEFFSVEAPEFVLWRLPLLIAAVVLTSVVWPVIVAGTMEARSFRSWLILVLPLWIALTLGETALASCIMLFDKPWPLLPVGMWPAVHAYGRINARGMELGIVQDLYPIVVIGLTRIFAFTVTLLLLRFAGMTFVRGNQSP